MARLLNYLKSLPLSEYRKGFFYIFSSKLLIATVGFLTTPILSRIYSPSEYGFFGLMSAVTLIMVLLSNLTLPTCLLAVKENEVSKTAIGIIKYSLLVNSLYVVVGVCLLLKIGNSEDKLGFPFNLLTIGLMSLSSFVITLTQVLANLNIRHKEFKRNVVVNLMDSISIRMASLLFGFLGLTKFGLFFSDLTGKLVNVIQQLRGSDWKKHLDIKNSLFEFSHLKAIIIDNKNYPLYNLPSSLISSFSNQLILWVLALSFSSSTVGYFTMSVGLLSIPLLLLANSLQPLITSKFINEKVENPPNLFLRLATLILLLSTFIYAFIYLIAPYFIRFYLSSRWLSSVTFVQILCFPFALQLVGNSLGGVYIVYNKQKANFFMKLFFLVVLVLGLNFQLARNADLKLVVILYSIIVSVEELVKIVYLALRLKHVRHS